jgi:hypothetical protein
MKRTFRVTASLRGAAPARLRAQRMLDVDNDDIGGVVI